MVMCKTVHHDLSGNPKTANLLNSNIFWVLVVDPAAMIAIDLMGYACLFKSFLLLTLKQYLFNKQCC